MFSLDVAAPIDKSQMIGPSGAYSIEYDRSLRDPEGFWTKEAEKLHWFKKPETILKYNEQHPLLYKWFPDGLFTLIRAIIVFMCMSKQDEATTML